MLAGVQQLMVGDGVDCGRGRSASWDELAVAGDDFLETCASEEIDSLVHHHLSSSADADGWPVDVREALARTARADAARELLRWQEMVDVLRALDAAGIRPILLKGAALAYSVYPNASARPRADTDLIVRRDETAGVRGALEALGYAAQTACDGDLLFHQFQMVKVDRFGLHHAFDVHWKISTQTLFADALTYTELEAESVPLAALDPLARGAGTVHALLLACIHRVMHHGDADWLIWSYDIHLLASSLSDADRDRFASLAIAKGVAAIAAHELARARSRFDTPGLDRITETLSQSSGESEPSAAYLTPHRRWHHDLASNMRGLPRWSDRVRLLREVMLPNRRYVLDAYGVAGRRWSRAILPALYMHRLVRGTWKVATGRK